MAHINRRFIDKHWGIFVLRGGLAMAFGFYVLFSNLASLEGIIAAIGVFLLAMGIIDSVNALYNSVKKHGWVNSVVDALIDVAAALALFFFAKDNLVISVVILAVYTAISGIIDILHGFLSTVDPTDRFIRILVGIIGSVMGFVIVNTGSFEVMTFVRFFGAYILIVGITSMIYGIHNRSQNAEDKIARKESRKAIAKTRSTAAKKSRK